MKSRLFLVGLIAGLFLGVRAQAQDTLIATEILGRPTDRSITVNAVAAFDADAYVRYGTASGIYSDSTAIAMFATGTAIEIAVDSLLANTRYYYRLCYRRTGTTPFTVRDEHTFMTQRAPGSTYRFTVEADPHLYDKKGSHTLMPVAMQNQLNDGADFMLDLGDTFGDDHNPYTITSEEMWQLHLNMRKYFGMLNHSSPLFFCLGNHEGENGYYLGETPPDNLAVYATLARQFYYPNPVPDSFYSGNTVAEGYGIGRPENYYAWEWGDALFVVLDAYRHYSAAAKPNGWNWTIGQAQYDWFSRTLGNSTAKFKFVFAHHVLGETRGAAVWANRYEWGGYNNDGVTWGFDANRPGWAMPLHQLMVANGVTIFFQGHDHLFAKEVVDGLIYQEVPMPCDSTYAVGRVNADDYTGDTLMNSGHLRVTVSGDGVQVEYVKAVLPDDETPEHPNGEVAYAYTIGSAATTYALTVIQGANGVISPGTTLVDSGGSQRFLFYPSAGYHVDSVFVDGGHVPDSTEGYTFTNVTASHTLTALFAPDSGVVPDTLTGTELLGRPTDNSVTLNVVPGHDMDAFVEYGTEPGVYGGRTDTLSRSAGEPFEMLIGELSPDTRYYYRFCYRVGPDTGFTKRPEHSFHTQRSAGSTFVFDVQADPHLGIPYSANRDTGIDTTLYKITLRNEAADNPDFLLDLGDTFMNEKYYDAGYDVTREAYLAHRPFFGAIGHSVPLFLVNGNHEGELGWKLNGTANNLALWSVRARNLYYPNPVPGGFYSGSTVDDPDLLLDPAIANKKRDGYYSWEWGNAIFVVLDPFWYTSSKPSAYDVDPDQGWKFTLGEAQYDWLRQTLEGSNATFKFVFLHNLAGGNSKDGRGGIEAAPYYEWGGSDITGNPEWDAMRAWSGGPVHDLLAANDVAAVLHGHDHFYCRQELDGVVYQECPQPVKTNYTDSPTSAPLYGYLSGTLRGNSGHLRFTVSDTAALVEYVRAYRPEDETPSRHNGDVSHAYTIRRTESAVGIETGWNILSLPVATGRRGVQALFPGATSSAFSFEGMYVEHDTLEPGAGYWMKFPAAGVVGIPGAPVELDSIVVAAGWNMVGSISEPVPVAAVTSDPPGILTSNFFRYTNKGYSVTDTIRPGCGYWVKVDQPGTLVLSSPAEASPAARLRIVPDGELPPSPPGEAASAGNVPAEYVLEQAYPSPFNPGTTIRYSLKAESRVTLRVYNTLGQVVRMLVDGIEPAGFKSVRWEPADLVSGVYFYRLEAASVDDALQSFIGTGKVVLMK